MSGFDETPAEQLERLEQVRAALLSTHELRASSADVVYSLLFELESYADDELVFELAGERACGLPMPAGELRGRLRTTLEELSTRDAVGDELLGELEAGS